MNYKRQILNEERRTKNQEHGFTLIELLVVILIIVVLSGITISVARYANWKARKAKSDIEELKIRSALVEYRALYGEYPIVGSPSHYSSNVVTDPDPETAANVPPVYRRVDLVNTTTAKLDLVNGTINVGGTPGIEFLNFTSQGARGSGSISIDYRLTYPLKMRAEAEGRAPFMDFPMVTVCFLTWRNVVNWTGHRGSVYDRMGILLGYYLKGDPVNRYMAINPETGEQWTYDCTDGTTYTLSKNGLKF